MLCGAKLVILMKKRYQDYLYHFINFRGVSASISNHYQSTSAKQRQQLKA